MNPIRHVRRLFGALAGLAGALLAFVAAPPAALARPGPPRPWQQLQHQPVHSLPPGWNKHPPLPAHIQAAATGGMSGWQVILIAAAAVVLAAVLAMMVYRFQAARRGTASTAQVIAASGTAPASSRPSAPV